MTISSPESYCDVKRLWLFSTFSGTGAADEVEAGVAHQRAGQETRLGQHLEAVADAEHRHAARAASATARMIGERAAMAPERR